MERKTQNYNRCIKCQHSSMNICPLFAGADIGSIDMCILEYNDIKNIKQNSFEEFVFYNYPKTFLQWMGKEKSLEIGDKVITLRSGFGSHYSGKILTITGINDVLYLAKENDHEYGIRRDMWYMDVFKLTT